MLETHEVTAQRIQQRHIVKRIRDADEQRHQHDRANQQHGRHDVKIRLGRLQRTAPGHLAPLCFDFALVR
jgi:hypothetical protein